MISLETFIEAALTRLSVDKPDEARAAAEEMIIKGVALIATLDGRERAAELLHAAASRTRYGDETAGEC